jgi:hypothetical protein
MILIVSNKWDLTVDFVVNELRMRDHPFLRLNTEDLSYGTATVCLPDFDIRVSKGGKRHRLAGNVTVIWNRRPGKPYDDVPKNERPSHGTQRFVNDQWYSWLESLQLLPGVTWINHPRANDAMESKVRQLVSAQAMGFAIPRTTITNDLHDARALEAQCEAGIVGKALYAPLIEEDAQDYFVFTNPIEGLTDADADQLRLAPVIFQEAIVPKVDYRVTVVGDHVFPVRIDYKEGGGASIDWRTIGDEIAFAADDLPEQVSDLCRRFVLENGLVFGAIDLLRRGDDFVFLEINPNGEWGWLQRPHNIPIAEALSDLMIRADHGRAQ